MEEREEKNLKFNKRVMKVGFIYFKVRFSKKGLQSCGASADWCGSRLSRGTRVSGGSGLVLVGVSSGNGSLGSDFAVANAFFYTDVSLNTEVSASETLVNGLLILGLACIAFSIDVCHKSSVGDFSSSRA
jgi:hypothetical protein